MAEFGKINLASFEHKIAEFPVKGSKEKIKCIVLPIEKNNFFLSKEGNCYLDIIAFKRKEPLKNDETGALEQTHLLKQSLPKTVRESMTESQKLEQPIIGNMLITDGKGFIDKPKEQDESFDTSGEEEDLPF